MTFHFEDNDKPIFLQLAEGIEENILKGIFAEEEQIPSTTEISLVYRINPATANKGVNMLVDEGIVYKRRGIGMFVAAGAKRRIAEKRKKEFIGKYVGPLLAEAENLGISGEELLKMIREAHTK
jgi:DNA-binding transcriptional regulator YhcF (GntR family)